MPCVVLVVKAHQSNRCQAHPVGVSHRTVMFCLSLYKYWLVKLFVKFSIELWTLGSSQLKIQDKTSLGIQQTALTLFQDIPKVLRYNMVTRHKNCVVVKSFWINWSHQNCLWSRILFQRRQPKDPLEKSLQSEQRCHSSREHTKEVSWNTKIFSTLDRYS